MQSFTEVFEQGAGHSPYKYQIRLAEKPVLPQILNAPTGTGKTAAAFFTWYWRRRCHPDEKARSKTPRRLVYCLPMRVLVEQTGTALRGYLKELEPEPEIAVHVLMGGDADEDWQLYPEKDAVIIGTQDMLLSRALNRGYAMNRFRWPIPFALLNNDALWVLDELQLMGAGMPTAAQLAAFRNDMGTFGPAQTMWMSATVRPGWLKTYDYAISEKPFSLSVDEQQEPRIKKRLEARKILERIELKCGAGAKGYSKELASQVRNLHCAGTQTLVVLNTVARARQVFSALQTALNKDKDKSALPELLLIHSRFRPPDRQNIIEKLISPVEPQSTGRIVISTQVIEAGVDITSALLVSELAPWSSMVQRFGRCNRSGETGEAQVRWIDPGSKAEAPYNPDQMMESRSMLEALEGRSVAPGSLPQAGEAAGSYQVLRRKDILELFDTAPDLSGNDVDVSRFIRDADDANLFVCWRKWESASVPPQDEPKPARNELCPVPLHELRELITGNGINACIWDYGDRRWRSAGRNDLFPGRILILPSTAGAYSPLSGWDPDLKNEVGVITVGSSVPEESGGDDRYTFTGNWQTLKEHCGQTLKELESLLVNIPALKDNAAVIEPLRDAALLHDLGKAHPVFQNTLLGGLEQDELEKRSHELWAKAPDIPGRRTHERPHFRHELATLLALLAQTEKFDDLTLYLTAAHHGKVRLAIRSLPGTDGHDRAPRDPDMILGVCEGDKIPPAALNGRKTEGCLLSLEPAALGSANGRRSWLARTLDLLRKYGPFRLVYLEMIIRTADIRASILARQGGCINDRNQT